MIIPDVNLLLYAYNGTSPHNRAAVRWLEGCLSGSERVGMPNLVVLGFVRLATSRRAFQAPMTVAEAAATVRRWLAIPLVEVLHPFQGHTERVLRLLETLGTAGSLVTDAQIAAHAIERDAVLHTADADFLRFPGLRWFNPITGAVSQRS
ncbi:MAG: PIN domain-containing protein [Thermoanaerobaculia bacterium]|nr:PIN domain-containing protein [Thermoanaerobaculia bacterium]